MFGQNRCSRGDKRCQFLQPRTQHTGGGHNWTGNKTMRSQDTFRCIQQPAPGAATDTNTFFCLPPEIIQMYVSGSEGHRRTCLRGLWPSWRGSYVWSAGHTWHLRLMCSQNKNITSNLQSNSGKKWNFAPKIFDFWPASNCHCILSCSIYLYWF